MTKFWKFMFAFTWIVIVGVLIFVAFILVEQDKSIQQQQIVNQYVSKGNGLSAYEVAVKNGFEGTEKDWLQSLNGTDSHSTNTVVQKEVKTETKVIEQVPVNGTNGKSSYDLWIDLGNVGTENDYLNSLKGEPGQNADFSLRFNADIGLFQSKKSTDTFWKSVPTCGGTSGRVCN